jgi:asparagine N-glycosylation enzyme membrane subunit Stt3
MQRRRNLIVTNLLALAVLLAVLLIGWWDAAVLGLVVLVFMDAVVLLGEWRARREKDREE